MAATPPPQDPHKQAPPLNDIDGEEAPLDPAAERVVQRMRRLALIGGLTMGVGFFAVFGAILYRILLAPGEPTQAVAPQAPTAAPTGTITRLANLPPTIALEGLADADEITALHLDGATLVIGLRGAAGAEILILDVATGAVLTRINATP